MPIYEYLCRGCGRKNTFLVLAPSRPPELVCRQCGGRDLEKLVSRVAVLRSEDDRMERMAGAAEAGGVDENDPRSVARWMKKMGREMGDEMGGDFDQSLDEALEGGASSDESGGPGGDTGNADAGEDGPESGGADSLE